MLPKKQEEEIDKNSLDDLEMPAPMPMLMKSKSVIPMTSFNKGLGMLDLPISRDEDSISTAPTSKSKKSGA